MTGYHHSIRVAVQTFKDESEEMAPLGLFPHFWELNPGPCVFWISAPYLLAMLPAPILNHFKALVFLL